MAAHPALMPDAPPSSLLRPSLLGGAAALVLLLALGAVLIYYVVGGERERDLLQWESRLGMVADAKVDAVERLVGDDLRNLRELAGNASLQLYLSQVGRAAPAGDAASGQPAELSYLRNLVWASADRYGFVPADEPRIPANVARTRVSGLALLDAGLGTVAATPGLGDLRESFGALAQKALGTPKQPAVDLLPDARGNPVLVYAVAVQPVLGAGAGQVPPPVGVVLAVRSAEQSIYPLLARGPNFAEESETLLLARRGGRVAYLSPTADGTGGLRRTLPAGSPRLAEAAAVAAPERFVALDNYRGRAVLQVGRPLRGEPWVLALQVDAAQALSEANQRRAFLLTVLSLLLVLVAAISVAAWRHGSSVRARHQAEELRQQAAKLQRQTDLLHTVTDSVDVLTLLVTRDDRVLFTNEAAARALGGTIGDVVGRLLGAVAGTTASKELARGVREARRRRGPVHELLPLELAAGTASWQAGFLPVERIGDEHDLVLIVLSDVTDVRRADEKRTDLLRRLVSTLVATADAGDPQAAQHAGRLREVANAVAQELQLDARERETLDLAATLANVGKLMVPAELLAKTGPLSEQEHELLRRHVDYALELLKGVDFDGPVLEVIAQKQERPDGAGYPKGLGDAQLSLAGKILAVANAFVALVSIRAYRQGMTVRQALDELLKGAGTQYDRRVLAALFHVVENRRDWSEWK